MSIDTARCEAVCGIENIARFLGMTRARARSVIEAGTLPSFDRDGEVCVRRTVLIERVRETERKAARRTR